MVFAPKVSTDGSIPQGPTVTSSDSAAIADSIGQVANLFVGKGGLLDSPGGGGAPSESTLKRQALEALSNSYREAAQLSAQGYNQQAQTRIRKAQVQYISSYGRTDEFDQVSATYGSMMPDQNIFDPRALQLQAAAEQPEQFATAFAVARASNPTASDAEVANTALNELTAIKANEFMIDR